MNAFDLIASAIAAAEEERRRIERALLGGAKSSAPANAAQPRRAVRRVANDRPEVIQRSCVLRWGRP